MANPPEAEFLEGLPEDRRSAAEAVHAAITAAAPDLEPWIWRGKMWGGTDQTILGYGTYDYVNSSGDEVHWFLIGLANQKAHLSVYVNAVRDGKYLGQVYADRLGKVKVGSASIGFRRVEDVDLGVLGEMVREAAGSLPA